jgi:hypothetical protein
MLPVLWVLIMNGAGHTCSRPWLTVLKYNSLSDLTPKDQNDSVLLYLEYLPIDRCLDSPLSDATQA